MDAPDVLTDEQMNKLGGVALPDTLSDDEMERVAEKPQTLPPTEDERLGIDSGLASPSGMVWDSRVKEFRKASDIGKEQPLPPGFRPEKPLIREDPAMTVATTIAGGGAGKIAGKAVGKLSPMLARIVEPSVAGGVTSALQGGDAMTNLKAAGLGAALGVPGAALQAVRGAPAAVAERLPTAVTGGLKSRAAKKVIASDITADVLDAHPDLKKVLATSTDPAERLGAAASTINKLEAENSRVTDAIQAHHGGVPVAHIEDVLDAAAQEAHGAGDLTTVDAVQAAKDNLARLAKDGRVTAGQLRGVRNALAARLETAPPGSPAAHSQAAATAKVKSALNEAIEDIASRTPGVDVVGLRERNKQIAALLPVQKTLEEQKLAEAAKKIKNPIAKAVETLGSAHGIAGLADSAAAKVGYKVATSPGLQRFAHGAHSPINEMATRSLMGGSAAALARGRKADELEFAAKVSQLMEGGMSLHDAMEKASEE